MATVKIKCHVCGNKYEVTESDMIRDICDFSGPDYYVFECPHCTAHALVDQFAAKSKSYQLSNEFPNFECQYYGEDFERESL